MRQITDHRDIRDGKSLNTLVEEIQPDLFTAAQALVRPAYKNPTDTWLTNTIERSMF